MDLEKISEPDGLMGLRANTDFADGVNEGMEVALPKYDGGLLEINTEDRNSPRVYVEGYISAIEERGYTVIEAQHSEDIYFIKFGAPLD